MKRCFSIEIHILNNTLIPLFWNVSVTVPSQTVQRSCQSAYGHGRFWTERWLKHYKNERITEDTRLLTENYRSLTTIFIRFAMQHYVVILSKIGQNFCILRSTSTRFFPFWRCRPQKSKVFSNYLKICMENLIKIKMLVYLHWAFLTDNHF